MPDISSVSVLVPVIDAEASGEIGRAANVAERLRDRLDDLRGAIVSGAEVVAGSLPMLAAAEGWSLSKVSASFGVTLAAEAGVIVSKASAATTLEVTVEFGREPAKTP